MDSHHQHQQQHQQCYYFHQQGQAHSSTREHMFEKPLTPSDVGKLNRLVIPKQQAERHFPLDTDSGEKGLLLSFEDESGKAWVFRYSYWTSSQSYVLTKGWSRFVKEKKLDAGDTVLFERHRPGRGGDLDDHLYIGCRRRVSETAANAATPPCFYTNGDMRAAGEQAGAAAAAAAAEMAAGSTKRLRLFGVNLECEPDRPDSWSQFMPTNASTSQL